MTDPFVALVFFAAVILVFCAAGWLTEQIILAKERERSRSLRRRIRAYKV